MIPPSINHEIVQYSAQLNQFLTSKQVDLSLILGFNSVIQSKFQKWIFADLEEFSSAFKSPNQVGQIDATKFSLIDLLLVFWSKFQYPIIKFYQMQHSEIFSCLVASLNALKKEQRELPRELRKENSKESAQNDGQNNRKSSLKKPSVPANQKPAFKAVEMRKLNDFFLKYFKNVSTFYKDVLSHIATSHENPLVPNSIRREIESSVSGMAVPKAPDATQSTQTTGFQSQDGSSDHPMSLPITDFHSTLSYIMFYCLLGLGNLNRHRAQIQLSYVEPGKSVSAYYKWLKENNTEHMAFANKLYTPALKYYFQCIALLPTMHEPYNHIGVIYNALGEKFCATLWFLRSQVTRDLSASVGSHNLCTMLSKPWLAKAYSETIGKPAELMTPVDCNNTLLRILAHYFYPKAFQKLLYVGKVEADLLDVLFGNPKSRHLVEIPTLVLDHCTVLFCFHLLSLTASNLSSDTIQRLENFISSYLTRYCVAVGENGNKFNHVTLANMRFILAFLRKNPSLMTQNLIVGISSLVSELLDSIEEEAKLLILESLSSESFPVRTHYFQEDVNFKDFTPIGCQFLDFKDEHLFKSGNVELLYGSHFYTEKNEIPSFLDNSAVLRIKKEAELGDDPNALQQAIFTECTLYENLSRLNAIVKMMKKVMGSSVTWNEEKSRFEVEKIVLQVQRTQAVGQEINKTEMRENRDQKMNGLKLKNQKSKDSKSKDLKSKDSKSKDSKSKDSKSKDLKSKGIQKETKQKINTVPTKPLNSEEISSVPIDPSKVLPSSIEDLELIIRGHAPKLLSKKNTQLPDLVYENMVDSIVSGAEELEESSGSNGPFPQKEYTLSHANRQNDQNDQNQQNDQSVQNQHNKPNDANDQNLKNQLNLPHTGPWQGLPTPYGQFAPSGNVQGSQLGQDTQKLPANGMPFQMQFFPYQQMQLLPYQQMQNPVQPGMMSMPYVPNGVVMYPYMVPGQGFQGGPVVPGGFYGAAPTFGEPGPDGHNQWPSQDSTFGTEKSPNQMYPQYQN